MTKSDLNPSCSYATFQLPFGCTITPSSSNPPSLSACLATAVDPATSSVSSASIYAMSWVGDSDSLVDDVGFIICLSHWPGFRL